MDPVSGAIIGAAFSELFVLTRTIMPIIIFSKTSCRELKEKLMRLQPTIDQISSVCSDSSQHRDGVFKEFQGQLRDGVHLVKKLEKIGSFNLYRKYRYGRKILKLEKNINDFMLTQGLANLMLDVRKIDEGFQDYSQRFQSLEEMGQHIIEIVNSKITNDANTNTLMLQQMNMAEIFGRSISQSYDGVMIEEPINSSFHVPDMPSFVVGLNNIINDVKELVFQRDVDVIGVKAMGGSGKTTLALALCNDPEVKDFFRNNILFITVSQFPNVKGLLGTMWESIVGGQRPDFQNVEDAHKQLQKHLRLRAFRPTLVVLDDVWSRSNLEKLLFEAEGYKTLITTRQDSTIPKRSSTRLYDLPLLQNDYALSLFCFWAFGQTSIPKTEDEDLVKQVQAECKGLPLALKVIGSSLHGEPFPVWESAKQKLSRAESISDYHKEVLLNCLETSIDVLDEEAKQCFLDLGAFPEGKKICVDALLDIWVYVRGMEWQDAFVILLELASRNLLNLTSDPRSHAISYGCGCELSFSQHDVMRDLALRLASQDGMLHFKRLFMPRKEDGIPIKWKTFQDHPPKAEIVSIHTGAMNEKQWWQIDFSEVEALVLFFAANEYCLPTFLHRMRKLKVLIIHNYSSKRAALDGLDNFVSLTQLKTLHLERLIVPPLYDYCRSLQNLEKLSISLCEGLGNITRLDKEPTLNFPKLQEINLDHCSDLQELPVKICDITSLQRLSITNCHLVHELPDGLGKLTSLRVLRLSACPSLAALPMSICKLRQLEFLDISLCRCLKDLPMGLGELSILKILDMRECSGLRQVPKELGKLRSLRHVICDEKTEQQWRSIQASALPDLTVEAVEERFNLDWLDE
eukprot:Gb_41056 [translate_table: standard]